MDESDCTGHWTRCCRHMGSCRRPVNVEGATTYSRLCAAVSERVSLISIPISVLLYKSSSGLILGVYFYIPICPLNHYALDLFGKFLHSCRTLNWNKCVWDYLTTENDLWINEINEQTNPSANQASNQLTEQSCNVCLTPELLLR